MDEEDVGSLPSGPIPPAHVVPLDRKISRALEKDRLLDVMLSEPRREISAAPPCKPGDRVRHAKLSTSTVVEQPVAIVGPDPDAPSGARDAGWRVSVEWDGDERGDLEAADWAPQRAGDEPGTAS